MIDFLVPPFLAILAAVAWFMSMVAGACTRATVDEKRAANLWFACSIAAVEFLVLSAWIAGRLSHH